MQIRLLASIILLSPLVVGCANLGTSPENVAPAYTSPLQYENANCDQLNAEMARLREREPGLVSSQNKRIKDNYVQAFLWMAGNGDGSETVELAQNRGAQKAVGILMTKKGCWNTVSTSPSMPSTPTSSLDIGLPQVTKQKVTMEPVRAGAAPGVGGLKEESKYMISAETLVKATGCTPPNIAMTSKGAGQESFIAGCPNGTMLAIKCGFDGCRILQ